ncbi:MAG: bifunctional glutamate--cysteine ligase GshA/glutathione synthetase GshB [Peptostreptococcaceae bacterium]
MLYKVKDLFTKSDLINGNFGVEREGLRVNKNGELSKLSHPKSFGSKITNKYITTDFSESQLELITPVFNSTKETYNFLNILYDIVSLEINDEFIWPQSMPSIIPDDSEIPLAKYSNDDEGNDARKYRELLLSKYGAKKQLISGIHYNFEFNKNIIKKLYEISDKKETLKEFKNDIYLKVTRNYLRYRWFVVYLLGCTGVVHQTFNKDCISKLNEISKESYSNKGALSYRNSVCGYTNNIDLFPNYTNITSYIESLNNFIDKDLINSHKELYAPIRLKSTDPKSFFDSLENEGINYLEFRNIDINPFERSGVSLIDLDFLNLFNIFLLLEDETEYDMWQEDGLKNQNKIASIGQNEINLRKNGKRISKTEWSNEILNKLKEINKVLNLDYQNVLDNIENKINDIKNTYTYKMIEKVKEEGYIDAHLNLAKSYRQISFDNRFKLEGYEDVELSTQILIKESIKNGIKFELLDRSDNFISLTKNNHTEYIKQATKTSKDNYVSVLAMENKVVTKKILETKNIKVPSGNEFDSLKDAINNIQDFINQKVVIKPKSTNFGLGISIFTQSANYDEIVSALKIAFSYDNTVLIEEFIPGKEYRFLVIGDKVCGILHRVPANVVGDNIHTIKELVEIKNLNPLRGKGYKTPLEKIELDESAKLFLNHKGLYFNYIPKKDEIVYLRENSNISTGGDSVDYTDLIPDKFKQIAVDASKAVDAKICGVDMMLEDFEDENSNYSIIELNFNPAIHIHSYPFIGTERNIATEILNLLDFKH